MTLSYGKTYPFVTSLWVSKGRLGHKASWGWTVVTEKEILELSIILESSRAMSWNWYNCLLKKGSPSGNLW